jgi:hypothetical protein
VEGLRRKVVGSGKSEAGSGRVRWKWKDCGGKWEE